MPVAEHCAKITMIFDLKGPSEVNDQAQFGVWGQFNFPTGTDHPTEAQLTALAAAARDEWVSGVDKADFSSAAELKTVIAAEYNADGTTRQEQRVVTDSGDWVGSQIRSLPWECSLCVSLYSYTPGTFIPHARRRRGRYYLPPLGAGVLANNSSGQLSDDEAMTLLSDQKDWLLAVTGSSLGSGIAWSPGVMSSVDSHLYALTDMAIDGKIDSQRRRERQQPATRQSLAFTA